KMRQEIVKRNQEVGLARIFSTTGYPSILDGKKHYIKEGKVKMPWDQYNYTVKPWAEITETINEVGSFYTCQGIDLNYTGIILSPPFYQVPDTNQIQ
ncbi:DNA/RNA helicase domain-containing protein, partial [Lactobacillus jensenii]|uniref:DNA/RNA helicase domain-containing protein n=1 Tax=Lactobacillus jensenii TaxID=109790 RepID=UPI00287060C4